MDPRGGGGWICLAVLCSGAALVLVGEDQGGRSLEQPDRGAGPEGAPNSTAGEGGEPAAWTSVPAWDGATSPSALPPRAAGNRSQSASAVPVRYWSPVIFVAVALLVLFLTYKRTKGEESSNQVALASDSSDLEEAADVPVHDTAPIVPPAAEERKGPEKPPPRDPTETVFCEPDAPPPQPSQPVAPAATSSPQP
ncbi:atherin-like isoform X2 [Dromaius novaehollandiae]|uniref:atherin-like isoform X2 n=1 Tax=Dromaius novaehollandiae TaxID=8790 RepID=UPI0031203158